MQPHYKNGTLSVRGCTSIYLVLLALLAASYFVFTSKLNSALRTDLGFAFAVSKTLVIAFFFMELRASSRSLERFHLCSFIIFFAILTSLSLIDQRTREFLATPEVLHAPD